MISVIMSVYNAEKYLKEAVDSILNQTYQDFEFIIFNDCSTDKSTTILKQYEENHPKIKVIYNTENLGLTKNLNSAIAIANGDYIARMDADDVSKPNRFENQMAFLTKHTHIDILGTFSNDIDENGKIKRTRTVPVRHSDIIAMLPKFSPISHPTVIFKKASLAKIGFYNPKYRTSQDLEMWFRAASAGLIFHNIPDYLFEYRVDTTFLSRKNFQFRCNDCKLRLEGYKRIKLPWYKYIYAFIPLALGMVPNSIYMQLRRLDPR
ncbi:glycosyltransferase [Winogradskyella schleiferi]|uniref:glycosyltransferase n=1 Tax=Winogradskyella schleiferi TaxID=2686078 RepID=UPI0015C17235|nr:glycosyltransferase [Winogradskyella schleiferi]